MTQAPIGNICAILFGLGSVIQTIYKNLDFNLYPLQ